MLKKVAFTMYPVKDLNRAIDFYKKNLGLIPSKMSANDLWIEYDLPGGGCFALTSLVENVSPSAIAGGKIAFEVDDLDQLVTQLKKDDVKFNLDTVTFPPCRMAVIEDSEGNGIILHELKKQ